MDNSRNRRNERIGEEVKILYHDDMDGRCAAAVVWLFAPGDEHETKCFPVDYNRRMPFEKIIANERVWVVDFSMPTVELWYGLLSVTADIVWIDYHGTAIEKAKEVIWPLTGPPVGIRIEGEQSGCELVWEYGEECNWIDVTRQKPETVRFIGDRDVWAWKFGISTAEFHAGLGVEDTNPESSLWKELLDGNKSDRINTVGKVRDNGRVILKFKEEMFMELQRKAGFDATLVGFEGMKVRAVNACGVGSEGFLGEGWQTGGMLTGYDVLMPFYWDGRQWVVSMYSPRGGLNVAVIAKQRGGGGHTHASGFSTETLPFELVKPAN